MRYFLTCIAALTTFLTMMHTQGSFDIESLRDYQKEYVVEEMNVCSVGKNKTYMSYKTITDRSSEQYKYIQNYMSIDDSTGLLYDNDGFIGIALGSYFGPIGSRYYVTLDTGIVLPVVKIEAKADKHTNNGCEQKWDGSVIEFVVDEAKALEYFGTRSNGYVLDGNFNNYELFKGGIEKIEKVTDDKRNDLVEYSTEIIEIENEDLMGY